MGEAPALLDVLRRAPRWHVIRWGGPGGQTLLSLQVAGQQSVVAVQRNVAVFDGRVTGISDGSLLRLLRDVERQRDEAVLATPAAERAKDWLLKQWRRTHDDAHGRWSFTNGSLSWGRADTTLHIEVGEGGTYEHPMPQPLVETLVDLGWRAPDHDFRNCWLQPPVEQLWAAARLAVLTPLAAFGHEQPPALSQ